MTTSLVLTVVGDDRPGLVEKLARAVSKHGGNWLESRMAHMAGKFTGIVHVVLSPERVESMTRDLRALENDGLRVAWEPIRELEERDPFPALRMELVGADHPGIVREISTALARRGVNVEELTTGCHSAPMSGEPLFRATAMLQLPPDVTVEELRAEMEAIANDLMVDLSLGR